MYYFFRFHASVTCLKSQSNMTEVVRKVYSKHNLCIKNDMHSVNAINDLVYATLT